MTGGVSKRGILTGFAFSGGRTIAPGFPAAVGATAEVPGDELGAGVELVELTAGLASGEGIEAAGGAADEAGVWTVLTFVWACAKTAGANIRAKVTEMTKCFIEWKSLTVRYT